MSPTIGHDEAIGRQEAFQSFGMAIGEVIENPHLVTALLEQQGTVTADVSGSAGDQNSHGTMTLFQQTAEPNPSPY